MLLDTYRNFKLDSPEYVASVVVWLASERAKFLSGRTIIVNWDVDELIEMKDKILEDDLLKVKLNAKLGAEQFAI